MVAAMQIAEKKVCASVVSGCLSVPFREQ